MKFILGVIIGAVVGSYLASSMTEEQRTKVGAGARKAVGLVRQSKVVTSVTDNASKVTDEVTGRVTDAVDAAGDKVVDAVSADDSTPVS